MSVETPEGHGIIGEKLGAWIADGQASTLPAQTVEIACLLLLDVTGLCISGRDEDYIRATLQATDPGGACTALGHANSFNAFDAALINGTAAHGEDYDDTFEGGPVHSGAVVVPAVLAACEREGLGGDARHPYRGFPPDGRDRRARRCRRRGRCAQARCQANHFGARYRR